MKKAIFILLLSFLAINVFAQNKPKGKVPKKSAASKPANTSVNQKLHCLWISDSDLAELIGAAADPNGFKGFIMTTPVPANQIKSATQYFQGVLDNIQNQQQAWIKETADSVATDVKRKADSLEKAKKP